MAGAKPASTGGQSDADVKAWVTEALRAGSIPGLGAHANVDLHDYVIDRYKPTDGRPYNLIPVRPKTVFGVASMPSCGRNEYSCIGRGESVPSKS